MVSLLICHMSACFALLYSLTHAVLLLKDKCAGDVRFGCSKCARWREKANCSTNIPHILANSVHTPKVRNLQLKVCIAWTIFG